MSIDYSHLDAIELRLSHEQARVRSARTAKEREWRQHNVAMIERELKSERAFLGLPAEEPECTLTLDEILAELDA